MSDSAFSSLPAVHRLAADATAAGSSAPGAPTPGWAVVEAVRRALADARAAIRAGTPYTALLVPAAVAARAAHLAAPSLREVYNATGVVLHTNLGRAPLPATAIAAVARTAAGYSNLEYDVTTGARGSRQAHIAPQCAALTGAEAAVVVNNNAAATVLGLAALAAGREVVVSRGELVEIGGAFRIPDILALSGCRLVEVGTTNKTKLRDYQAATTPATALWLKVHRSNFAIVGFTEEVEPHDLVPAARAAGVGVMVDLGSGALLSTAQQAARGLPPEASVPKAVASGADLVCFSGDKLLGGPQAGVLVGHARAIALARAHPLMRALRPDKLTLAALAATLDLYRDGRQDEIPAVAALGTSAQVLRARADALCAALAPVSACVVATQSAVGGGALPMADLPSWAVRLTGVSATRLEAALRAAPVPVVARIEADAVLLDVRTLPDDVLPGVVASVRHAWVAVAGDLP